MTEHEQLTLIDAAGPALRRAVQRYGTAATGLALRDAKAFATEQLLGMIDREEITVDPGAAVEAALNAADKADRANTDRVIKALADGQVSLDLEGDPILDLLVTLGDGRRKLWRNVGPDDLVEMDRLRYRNVRNAEKAYADWHRDFNDLHERLVKYGTVGALPSTTAGAA